MPVGAPSLPEAVRMGAEVQAEQASAAQKQVNQIMQKAIAAVREAGVAREDVQTSTLSLEPVYSNESHEGTVTRKLLGYRAQNVLEIRLAELSKTGPVIDVSIAVGANRLEGMSFELKNDREQRRTALDRAAQDARRKGEELAVSMGVRITSVESVDEENVEEARQGLFAGSPGSAGESTPVEAGRVRLKATVSVRYRIAQTK